MRTRPQDAPEVVSYPNGPEVVDHSGLEVYRPANHDGLEHIAYGTSGLEVHHVSPNGQEKRPHQYNQVPQDESVGDVDARPSSKSGRICGIGKRACYWVSGVVVAIIVLAAILGGVLGSVLKKHNTPTLDSNSTAPSNGSGTNSTPSSPPPQLVNIPSAMPNSGFAFLGPGSQASNTSISFSYYQDIHGSIIENVYLNSSLQAIASSVIVDVSVGALQAAANGTPIASSSWQQPDQNYYTYRNVFYFNSLGNLMMINTTGSGIWTTPYGLLTTDSAVPNSIALTVCSSSGSMRVYYASSTGQTGEISYDYGDVSPTGDWYYGHSFWSSVDFSSGVGCAVSNKQTRLYWRNSTTGLIAQWIYGASTDVDWTLGAVGATNITNGSDIAVANDGTSTDYIFYQTATGQITRALYTFEPDVLSDYEVLHTASTGSKLAAAYYNGSSSGAIVMYQNSANLSNMYFQEITRAGQQVADGVVT